MRWLLLRAFLYALRSSSQTSNEDVKGDPSKLSNDHIKEGVVETSSLIKSNGTDKPSNQEGEDPLTLLGSTIVSLNELNSEIQAHLSEMSSSNDVPLQSPLPSRLRLYKISKDPSRGHLNAQILIIESCLFALSNESSKAAINLESSINELVAVVENLETEIENTNQVFKLRGHLESLVDVVETICFFVRFLQVIRQVITKPAIAKGTRKKKGNKDQASSEGKTLELREAFHLAQSKLKDLCDIRIPKACADLHPKIKNMLLAAANGSSLPWLEESDARFLSNNQGVMETWKKVVEKLSSSYGASLSSVKDTLSNKSRCVSQLKL